MISRRILLAAPALLLDTNARAQPAYPSRPVSLVIPYPPGGGTDTIGRAVAQVLERQLGQPVIVENRAGGATSIGSTYVAQARPDGYTLLMGANSLAINPVLQPSLTPRDPQRELAPIGMVYRSPLLLLVHPSIPAQTLPEFLAYARSQRAGISYGSSGNGSANHLIFALLSQRAGIPMEHIPYRGAAPALLDLQAGRIQALFNSALLALPLIREVRIRALAVSSEGRIAAMPEIPAISETLPGFDAVFWQGLFAPAGTPPAVVARLSAALGGALSDGNLRARVALEGGDIVTSTPEGLAAASRKKQKPGVPSSAPRTSGPTDSSPRSEDHRCLTPKPAARSWRPPSHFPLSTRRRRRAPSRTARFPSSSPTRPAAAPTLLAAPWRSGWSVNSASPWLSRTVPAPPPPSDLPTSRSLAPTATRSSSVPVPSPLTRRYSQT
jgi:tripartite-type tricarboxylate transporter receptor subunit TctC